ncbi:MAG TPA: hypothetical protein VM537_16300 [Anaerolineae bacterium]|nr:hypothetical protein [Anaerolineae bacterium]
MDICNPFFNITALFFAAATLYYLFKVMVGMFMEIPRWANENRDALRFWGRLLRLRGSEAPDMACLVVLLRVIVGAVWTVVSGLLVGVIMRLLFGG